MATTTPTATKPSLYEAFHLKTDGDDDKDATAVSTPEDTKNGDEQPRQGRLYSTKYSQQPGGIKVEEMIYGIKMAHISCTDDSEERLKGSGANTLVALEKIVGKENVHKPLLALLKDNFGLTMDVWMNESGVRMGRAVDTQGFIASNDDTIVLSYRFSTTGLDWMTNLSMTTSEWEPDRDELIGHAGLCSCFDGLYTRYFTDHGKPRVHTGFYNNFIYTIPYIRKHIVTKLLQVGATPKKVYICGCSLGAAIATLAFCFVLQEMQPSLQKPEFVNHKLINVTAGCPRVCEHLMKETVMKRMATLQPLDRAVLCRLVYNHDLVPHIPFNSFGFYHLDKLVYITPEGDVIVNPKLRNSQNFAEVKQVFSSFSSKKKEPESETEKETKPEEEKTPFEIECEKTPEPIKHHMPFWYLTNLEKLKEKADAGQV